jgi:hypothetical protein
MELHMSFPVSGENDDSPTRYKGVCCSIGITSVEDWEQDAMYDEKNAQFHYYKEAEFGEQLRTLRICPTPNALIQLTIKTYEARGEREFNVNFWHPYTIEEVVDISSKNLPLTHASIIIVHQHFNKDGIPLDVNQENNILEPIFDGTKLTIEIVK